MPATSAPVILTGSFPQSLGLSFLSQQQCPQASNYCNTISLLSSQLTRAFFLPLPVLTVSHLNKGDCNILDGKLLHIFQSCSSHLCSHVCPQRKYLQLRELSWACQYICTHSVSIRQLAPLQSCWLLVLVRLGCYLCPKQRCWQHDSLFHIHTNTHRCT